MELEKAIKICKTLIDNTVFAKLSLAEKYTEKDLEQAIDTVLNRLEELENRYLELTINGKTFKIKNDVKKLKYTDFKDNEFTLEVLEKWN